MRLQKAAKGAANVDTFQRIDAQSAVVRVGSYLTYKNATHFTRLARVYLNEGIRFFVLDFSQTGQLDSAGLGAVFTLYRAVAPRAGAVLVAAPSTPVQVVLQMARIYRVLPLYSTVDAALRAITP